MAKKTKKVMTESIEDTWSRLSGLPLLSESNMHEPLDEEKKPMEEGKEEEPMEEGSSCDSDKEPMKEETKEGGDLEDGEPEEAMPSMEEMPEDTPEDPMADMKNLNQDQIKMVVKCFEKALQDCSDADVSFDMDEDETEMPMAEPEAPEEAGEDDFLADMELSEEDKHWMKEALKQRRQKK